MCGTRNWLGFLIKLLLFFLNCSQILPKPSETVMLASSMDYEGIKTYSKVKALTTRQKGRRKVMLEKNLVGFPCKPRYITF